MAIENKLTDKLLKSLAGKPQDRQKIMADGRGLSVRVSVVGGISFVFYYRIGGRDAPPVWLTLGRYPDMSLAAARRSRDQCREWLAENLDPRRQIKLVAEKNMRPVTVRDAVLYWYDNHARTARKQHEYLIKRFEKHIFPYIGDMAIEQCKLHTWLTVFDRIKKMLLLCLVLFFLILNRRYVFAVSGNTLVAIHSVILTLVMLDVQQA
ncbi:Arm DNA-binding domain-containing protein [Escherichia coli]